MPRAIGRAAASVLLGMGGGHRDVLKRKETAFDCDDVLLAARAARVLATVGTAAADGRSRYFRQQSAWRLQHSRPLYSTLFFAEATFKGWKKPRATISWGVWYFHPTQPHSLSGRKDLLTNIRGGRCVKCRGLVG